MKIVFIGAGNVATQLGAALLQKNHSIAQVYSRTEASASLLASRLQSGYTTDIRSVITDADLYFFSVRDSVIEELLESMPMGKGLYVHTAGSIPMHIFEKYTERYGVFYPLQTFSKNRDISFEQIPVLLETVKEMDGEILRIIAQSISNTVQFVSSENRKYIHLAAVFACNFTNHMYTLAADILNTQELDWKLLIPLIEETAAKTKLLHPIDAQTGPAVRHDREVMRNHMELLNDKNKKRVYRNISQSIGTTVSSSKNSPDLNP